jgi:hypothetical protein
MTGGGAVVAWWGVAGRRRCILFIFCLRFLIGLTCGAFVYLSKKILFFATSVLQVGLSCQFSCQFAINSKSVHIANCQQICRGFL